MTHAVLRAALVGLALVFSTSSGAEDTTSATPAIIAGLRENSAKLRVDANREMMFAQQNKDLADGARLAAQREKNPTIAAGILDGAKKYDQSAAEHEERAIQMRRLAEAQERRASELEHAVNKVKAQDPKAPIPLSTAEIIADLRVQAATDRLLADAAQKKADEWRRAAEAEQKVADSSNDPNVKARRERDAHVLAERAAEFQKEADEYRRRADEAEAKANRLAGAAPPAPGPGPVVDPPAPTPLPAPVAFQAVPCRKLAPSDFVGVWRERATGHPYAIVPADQNIVLAGGAPFRLLVDAKLDDGTVVQRSWEGTYDAAAECGRPRLTFRYKPKAEEMKPLEEMVDRNGRKVLGKDGKPVTTGLPLWARKKAEALKLEWTLELSEPLSCGGSRLKAVWFAGEVDYDPAGEKNPDGARIRGKGAPRTLELNQDLVVDGDALAAPAIVLSTRTGVDPWTTPVPALVKLQRFDVLVALPKEAAKKAGTSINVTVRNLTHKDSTTLKATTVPAALNRPHAIYQLESPATIADFGQETGRTTIPIFPTGDRISLSARDGDLIEFTCDSCGEAIARVRIFNTVLGAEIARQAEVFAELKGAYQAVVDSRDVLPDNRQLAGRRIRMIENAQAIINDPNALEQVRYAVGAFYLEQAPPYIGKFEGDEGEPVLQRRQLRWYGPTSPVNPLVATPAGVEWTSLEETDVNHVIHETKARLYEDVLFGYRKAGMFAAYTWVAQMSAIKGVPMATVWSLLTNTDIYGQPLDKWDRTIMVAGIVSSWAYSGLRSGRFDKYNRNISIGFGRQVSTQVDRRIIGGRETLPSALRGERPQAPAPAAVPGRPVAGDRCRPVASGPPSTTPPEWVRQYALHHYGPNATLRSTTPALQRTIQGQRPTCNLQAVANAYAVQTGIALDPPATLRRMRQVFEKQPDLKAKFDERNIKPEELHFTNEDTAALVPAMGGQVIDLKKRSHPIDKLHAFHKTGWLTKDSIFLAEDRVTRESAHAVVIADYKTVPIEMPGHEGVAITGVGIIDSNISWIVDVPLCDYEAIRVPTGETQGTQLIRFELRPKPN